MTKETATISGYLLLIQDCSTLQLTHNFLHQLFSGCHARLPDLQLLTLVIILMAMASCQEQNNFDHFLEKIFPLFHLSTYVVPQNSEPTPNRNVFHTVDI